MKKIYVCLAAAFLFCNQLFSQAVFRSNVATGNWNVAGSWIVVSGTDGDGNNIPDSDDDVFIQAGHTITLTATQACKDLHISTGTTDESTGGEGLVDLSTYNLQVYGKLRCYYAPVGTTPGNSTTLGYAGYPFSGIGTVRAMGNSRNLTVAGEWSDLVTNTSSGTFALYIDLNAGQTVSINTNIQCNSLTASAGTLNMGAYTAGLDMGFMGGTTAIGSGAIIISSASGINIFQRSGNSPGNLLFISPGGKLVLTGADPKIQMTNYSLSGTVEYAGSNQTWADKGTDPTTPGSVPILYTNVTLSNTGVKTSVANTNLQVSGTFSLQGTASFVRGTASFLQYFPGSNLEYAGAVAQASTDEEFPAVSGPVNLTINNTNGVSLHADRTITGALTFAGGNISLGVNNLTIGSAAGYNSTRHVVTDNTGKLFFPSVGAGFAIFPIGPDATSINPVAVSNGLNIKYGARVVTGFPFPIYIANNAVNRTWFVEAATTPAGTVNVNFFYSAGHGNAGFNYTATVDHGVYTSGWNINQTGLTQAGSYQVATQVASFVGATELPMVIGNLGSILTTTRSAELTAKKTNNGALLNWMISFGTAVKEITVERSADGRIFDALLTVTPAVTWYTDDKMMPGNNFYRIKITDANGKVSYSSIAAIINSAAGFDIVNLLPTIVTGTAQLNAAAAKKSTLQVVVTDAAGRTVTKQVYNMAAGSNLFDMNMSGLAPGVYYLTASSAEGEIKTIRFVKQ